MKKRVSSINFINPEHAYNVDSSDLIVRPAIMDQNVTRDNRQQGMEDLAHEEVYCFLAYHSYAE